MRTSNESNELCDSVTVMPVMKRASLHMKRKCQDDVRQFVVRRVVREAEGNKKAKSKVPKIQRLITPALIQRKRKFRNEVRKRMELSKSLKVDYHKRLTEYHQQQKALRSAEVAKKKKEKK